MAKLTGVETGQVEPETRPEQSGTQPESEPESRCANCNGVLGDNDGSYYCRRCEWWIERDDR